MQIHTDKCFLNGKIILFKDLPNDIKFSKNRLSYTSLKTINQCPYRYNNETWDDIGLSDNDSSAHGTLGHYIVAEYLQYFSLPDFNKKLFDYEVSQFIFEAITKDKSKARLKIKFDNTYLKSSFDTMYVTHQFDFQKFASKVYGYTETIEDLLYHIPVSKIRNLYIETGIYRVSKGGSVVFGKADLIIEFTDGTYSIIDHKSTLNPLYFEPMQLKMYARLLNKPIRDLAVFELSSGHYIKYDNSVIAESIDDANSFITKGIKTVSANKAVIGEHCNNCPVNCFDRITDEDGYTTI